MTNQEIKADAGKPKLSLVPSQIIYAIARIREYGNNKYPAGGKDNWKNVEPERYIDAAYRHLLAFKDDPTGIDKESGYPHLWHLACNVAFLCELIDMGEVRYDTTLTLEDQLNQLDAVATAVKMWRAECETCRHQHVPVSQQPCRTCHDYVNYEKAVPPEDGQ